ncbi:hypothetical protein [Kribbella sp. NPDC006257]
MRVRVRSKVMSEWAEEEDRHQGEEACQGSRNERIATSTPPAELLGRTRV